MQRLIGVLLFLLLLPSPLLSQRELSAKETLEEARVRGAIEKAITLLEAASDGSAEHRMCFSCHGQAMPVLALTEARQHGFAIDEENLQRLLDHTTAFLRRGRKSYLDGKGQGGRVDTAGYALWTLEAGQREPTGVTDAVIGYVLGTGAQADFWKHSSDRPPSEASDFTTTYLALRAISVFADEKQQTLVGQRTSAAARWLLESEPRETEDRVFHLRSLSYTDASDEVTRGYADALISQQRDDGGWAQKTDMASDAYATATTLVALVRSDQMERQDPTFQKGLAFLLDSQKDDGSWHVVSRSKPFQKYFESGFPHEKDQFISTTATAWSTIALTLALPEDDSSKR